jgi:hypothetical protein
MSNIRLRQPLSRALVGLSAGTELAQAGVPKIMGT